MIEKIKETAAYIAAKVQVMPKTAIILGTGLGELVDHITDKTEIPYTAVSYTHLTLPTTPYV